MPRVPEPTPLPELPGFWRVHPGMLIEAGDSVLDTLGEPHELPLERVGQPVNENEVVLRVERRRHSRA